MKRNLIAALAVCWCLGSNLSWAGANFCSNVTSEFDSVKYCAYPGAKDKVILYLYGFWADEYNWEKDLQKQITQAVHDQGKEMPTVISTGFGKTKFLSGLPTKNGNSDVKEYLELVFSIIDGLRAKGVINRDAAISLFGNSMGGFNALMFMVRNPSLFSRVALICPAGSRVSPFSSDEVWEKNFSEEGGNHTWNYGFRQLMKSAFGSGDLWENESPLEYLQRRYRSPVQQPIYISKVKGDGFGFNLVEDVLANTFKSYGHPVQTEIIEGRHCTVNPSALAQFLVAE